MIKVMMLLVLIMNWILYCFRFRCHQLNIFVFYICPSLEEEKAKKDPKYYLNRANKDTLGILSELEKTYKEPVSQLYIILQSAVLLYYNSMLTIVCL